LKSSIVWLWLPKRRHVKIEIYVNPICLRVWLRVLDLDGSVWERHHPPLINQISIDSPKIKTIAQKIWLEKIKVYFEESLERVRNYYYIDFNDFVRGCKELEIYINHMALMGLEQWLEGLQIGEIA